MVARFRPHKRSDALNKNRNSIIASIRRPVYYLVFVVVLVASTIQSTFTTTTAHLLFEKSFKTDQAALPEHQVATSTIPWSITKTATESSLSEVLDSEEYFVRNSHNLTFQTHVRVWKDTAKLCLEVTLNDPQGICPFPSFRARLSGAAIVNVPLDVEHGSEIDADRFDDKPHGCILFPVTGTYHLDVILLHCTMNAWPRNVSAHDLRKLCPVLPEARENVSIYNITVEPFERTDDVVSLVWPARNPFPRRVFVFAPRCLANRNEIGAHCTNESTAVPPVLRVDHQSKTNQWNTKVKQFQNYVYLEVNPKNGAVNYNGTFTLPRLAKPPKDFASDETVCFLGDSHARYVSYQTRVIYQNKVGGKTGCNDKHLHTGHESTSGQFRYSPMNFGNDFLYNQMINSTLFADCNLVFILYGHWDAGYPRKFPTTPYDFASVSRKVMERVQNISKEGTRIYMGSSDPHPLSNRIVECVDWRFPALIDVYNAYLRNMTVEGNRPGERRFVGLQNAFYMDNTDIMDHIWDEAHDFNHPCEFGFRPMAYRILSIMKHKATGMASHVP